ncbi:hypothetical protein EI94DRAFT_1813447 [Lactarius quietus]|nr:hypothetical protein EI94DRAFT_1813447 [Lactarius quietus]
MADCNTLDVIVAICTLAIKIQASGQQIKYFQTTQLCCGLPEALKIPLHSNIHRGTALKMLDQANKLCQDSNCIQQYFSSEKQPTLWHALPALEELQSAWRGNMTVQILHPYYKLAYIKHTWGGPEEQVEEIEAGNPDVKDWQDKAKKIVERMMAQYYKNWLSPPTPLNINGSCGNLDEAPLTRLLSEFNKLQETLLTDDADEGWASKLQCYLGVEFCNANMVLYYPTFTGSCAIVPNSGTDCSQHTALSGIICSMFCGIEELVIMKSAWGPKLYDMAAWNFSQVEEEDIFDFEDMLIENVNSSAWDAELAIAEGGIEFSW